MRHLGFAVAVTCLASLVARGASAEAGSAIRLEGAAVQDIRSCGAIPTIRRRHARPRVFSTAFCTKGRERKGNSVVRKVELESGKVVHETKMHPQYFGEGITIAQGKVFQLTWQDRAGFVYDAKTLKFIRNFSYFGEGWGLTHDPAGLVMSDGTSTLRFLEVDSLSGASPDKGDGRRRPDRAAQRAGDDPGRNLGQRLADRLHRAHFAKEGRVLGWINLKGLLGGPIAKLSAEAVLNGIAFDAQKNRIFVTGKLWPRLFEITVK